MYNVFMYKKLIYRVILERRKRIFNKLQYYRENKNRQQCLELKVKALKPET